MFPVKRDIVKILLLRYTIDMCCAIDRGGLQVQRFVHSESGIVIDLWTAHFIRL